MILKIIGKSILIDDYIVNIGNTVEIHNDYYNIIEVSYCVPSSLSTSSLTKLQYNAIVNNVRSFAIALAGNNNNNEKFFISPLPPSNSSLSLSNDTIKRYDIGHRSLQWVHFLQNIKQ